MTAAGTFPDPSSTDLAPIPGGVLTIRDARTQTSRDVTLEPFRMGRVPVTWQGWSGITGTTGLTQPTGKNPDAGPSTLPAHGLTWLDAVQWCNAASLATGLRPAYDITNDDVVWDVSAEGYRLPTEAEWEWAARAGTVSPTYGPLPEIAWTGADALDGPQPVAGKTANGYGLFDMIGNVWEWCWDYADTARYGDYRSLRGGGWDDPAWSSRASVRRGSAPDAALEDVGFRVVSAAVGHPGALAAQGWSDAEDRRRADLRGPRPIGWTPLRR